MTDPFALCLHFLNNTAVKVVRLCRMGKIQVCVRFSYLTTNEKSECSFFVPGFGGQSDMIELQHGVSVHCWRIFLHAQRQLNVLCDQLIGRLQGEAAVIEMDVIGQRDCGSCQFP